MKAIYHYLKFFGVILLLPILITLSTLLLGFLSVDLSTFQYGMLTLVIATSIFAVIFYKDIKFRAVFQAFSIKTTLVAFIIAFVLFLFCDFVENLPKDLSFITPTKYSTLQLLFYLSFTPIMEELACRIIIINRFNKKIPSWVLVLGTSLLFAFLHIRDVYLFTSAFFMGFVLARLFLFTRNGALLILIHFFYNLIVVYQNMSLFGIAPKVVLFYYTPGYYILVGIAFLLLLVISFIKPTFFNRKIRLLEYADHGSNENN